MLVYHKTLLLFILGLVCLCTANIQPAKNFNAANDARTLYEAVDGPGTNEKKIINVLTKRTLAQRLEIKNIYPRNHRNTLQYVLEDDISGNFLQLMLALIKPMPEYYAELLAGATEKSEIVTDIILDSTPEEMKAINEAYIRLRINPEVDLPTLLVRHRQLLTHHMIRDAFNGGRSQDQTINDDQAHVDAYVLLAGNVEQVEEIFSKRSYKQLTRIFEIFEDKTKTFVEDAFTYREYPFALESSILDIIQYTKSKTDYFAKRLYNSMHGAGTNDKMLIRIIVSRSEKDLTEIKDAFETLYGLSLSSYIHDDTSGDYRDALLSIVEQD